MVLECHSCHVRLNVSQQGQQRWFELALGELQSVAGSELIRPSGLA
jgi:hypothetical protein